MPDIKIASLEGIDFGAYAAQPRAKAGAGLLVLHDHYGLNAAMRERCDAFALHGYEAVCPNLFGRGHPGDLKSFDVELAVRDMLAALAHVRGRMGGDKKVGVVGYGFGGRLAYLMAARSDVEAVVVYCGTDIDKHLDEIHDIRMPVLLHMGEADALTPPEKRSKILRAITRNPAILAEKYDGVGQGFAFPLGVQYAKEAAERADARTLAFLAENLNV